MSNAAPRGGEDTDPIPSLDAALLAAHAGGARATLITLYASAASVGPVEAEAFFLTQAYVLALEAGDPRAGALRDRLVALGAETA